MNSVKLHFLCGKMAAGKSTFARELAQQQKALLLVEDELLAKLFPEEIRDLSDYVKYSARLKSALSEHIVSILAGGTSLVLDFPGNTTKQRSWFRELFERAGVAHELHYIDVPDELCKKQLKERSKAHPDGAAFTADAEFEAITRYFEAPSTEEHFNVTVHVRGHP